MARKDNMPDWAKQQIADEKAKPKQDKAYNDAMVNTPAAPKKKYAKGGSVRGDGCAMKGKTKGKMY